MAISVSPKHLKRYKDIARLLLKYGRSDLVADADLEEGIGATDEPTEVPSTPDADALAVELEQLGPTFVKLGQLMSTRADLLPLPYLTALARLQDDVKPFPFEEVERIVTEELGVRLSKGFEEFDPEPIAAASLGQVHRARLRSGREVAVKVQRPGIRQIVADDLDAIDEIAAFMARRTEIGQRYDIVGMAEEFRRSLIRELDYHREARNLSTLRENLKEFTRIVVPAPIDDYTTSRILTMEYVRGRKITSVSKMSLNELDGAAIAEELFRAYLKQILADGFFHADPHPGNVFLTFDGRIALIDLGMTAHIGPEVREKLLKLLLAVSEGRSDEAADVTISMAEPLRSFNERAFRGVISDLVANSQGATAEEIQVGRIVIGISRACGETGLYAPSEMTMLGKTLLNLDLVGRTLDPEFDPNAAVRRNAADMLRRRVMQSFSPGNFFSNALELHQLVQHLPARLNKILDDVAENRFEVKVNAHIDEVRLVAGMQKIANRITLGAVLAALILSAAMLMRVESTFRIWGYPGFAILLFIAAVVGGVMLMINIVMNDRDDEPPPR
jgi:ubiquinone biosynthesis protein